MCSFTRHERICRVRLGVHVRGMATEAHQRYPVPRRVGPVQGRNVVENKRTCYDARLRDALPVL